MSFQELMETGGADERQKVKDLERVLQSDDPINIQFTSVSYHNWSYPMLLLTNSRMLDTKNPSKINYSA